VIKKLEMDQKKSENLIFYISLKMQMFAYHDETNGRPFRSEKMTKPFIKWLSERNPELLKECEKRIKKGEKND